jgi:hypothetical protein
MALLDEIVAQDIKQPYLPESSQGLQAYKGKVETLRKAFPDLHITVDEIIGEGDWVAVSTTKTGTHKGPFMDLTPTGKSITEHSTGLLKVVDGKIVELRGGLDMESIMQQLRPKENHTLQTHKKKVTSKTKVKRRR